MSPPRSTSPSMNGVSSRSFAPQLKEEQLPPSPKKEKQLEISFPGNKDSYKWRIHWSHAIFIPIWHILAIYGTYDGLRYISWKAIIFHSIYGIFNGIGVTAGCHRLWSHRAYKAKLPLRIFLMIMESASYEGSIYHWCRDHRVHHKYSETDADPYNAKRGFFFSHVGWICLHKEPEVIERGRQIDLSDLIADPVVNWQHRYFYPFMITWNYVIPTAIPWILWDHNLLRCFCASMARWVIVMNFTWLVNSAAHMFGQRPYDVTIQAVENKTVALLALGEGFHNFHHSFPKDYKTSELGDYGLNLTTMFIDFMAYIGQAYDLKTVSPEHIQARIARCGPQSKQYPYKNGEVGEY